MNKSCLAILLTGVCSLLFSASVFAQQSWSPAGDNIKSRWASSVSPTNALPEYPRPQMARQSWKSLNGLWNYAIISSNDSAERNAFDGGILVPYPIESSLSGVGKTISDGQALLYQRTFEVPKAWKGKNIILNFGAVDWSADIYINGIHAISHTGGYTPISVDITPYLTKKGKQTISVKVEDAADQSFQPRGKQVRNPSGIWYTSVTGIWQSVWIEAVSKTHIEDYYAESNIDKGQIEFVVDAVNSLDGDVIKVDLLEGGVGYNPEIPSSNVIASSSFVCEGDSDTQSSVLKMTVPSASLWSPESPYLYGVKISIERDGKKVDEITGYTSMRKISVVTDSKGYKRMALNNKPLFQYGPLDQGWWPDGLYTAPTDEALHYDIKKTKDFGFNLIRKHIKVEPARWYMWCDVEGILVWQDMPCIADFSLKSRPADVVAASDNKWSSDSFIGGTDANIPSKWKDNYYQEWNDIIMSLRKFQCIVVWVPFNEAWGQFDTPDVVEFTRSLDSTRLINPSSGGNYSFTGDIIDVHHYPQPMMNAFEAKFVNVLGEYGGIGLPLEGHLWQKDRNWGYVQYKNGDEVLKTYTEFAQKLKTFISIGCSAAIYTQTTDVEGEVNGLMTYDREIVKMDEKALNKVNSSVIQSMNEN